MTESQRTQIPLFFKLCSDHLSIEAIPRSPLAINFEKMKEQSLRQLELMMWTPHFVVLKNASGEEITLRKDGRMVIRKANTEQDAREAADEVMSIVTAEFRV